MPLSACSGRSAGRFVAAHVTARAATHKAGGVLVAVSLEFLVLVVSGLAGFGWWDRKADHRFAVLATSFCSDKFREMT